MIEEYGTLSEEELLQQLLSELEENGEIDISDLEFTFEEDKLKITGSLATEAELDILMQVLEDHVDPEDYSYDLEIIEEDIKVSHPQTEEQEDEGANEDFYNRDGLEEVDEEDMDADFLEDEEDDGSDKWQ